MSSSVRALLFLLPVWLGAQTYTASVRGAITDSTRAAVPSALVIATDVERNIPYSTKADSLGRYVLPTLPPAIYTLSVAAPGFATHTQPAFPLAVQQQATIDVEMSVGPVATTVDVTGNAPLLNTTGATLGQLVENKFILSVPLVARNPLALV